MESVKSKPNTHVANSSTEWFTTEAVAKHKAGESQAAISYYLKVIKMAQSPPAWIYGNVITLLAKVERSDEGIELGNRALEIHSESDEIYRAIAIASDRKGDNNKSIECYRQAIKINSEQPLWVYYRLTELLTKENALDEAIAIGQQGIKQNPNSHWLYYYVGEALAAKPEWEQAIAAYIRSLELKSDFIEASQKLDYALEHRQTKPEKATTPLAADSPIKKSTIGIEGSIVVKITEVTLGGMLRGWAIDNQTPNKPIKFRVLANHKPIQDVNTGEVLDDELTEGLAGKPRKFEVQLPVEILNDREHLFELLPLDRGKTKRQPIYLNLTVPRRAVGVVDLTEGNRLRGWALPEGHTEGAAKLDVYIDDIFYSEIQANVSRPDLLKQGLGNGKNGFDFTLPLPVNQEHKYQVAVVFSGTQQDLKRSPIFMEGSPAKGSSKNSVIARVTEIGLGGILRGWAIDNAQSDRAVPILPISSWLLNPVSLRCSYPWIYSTT